MLAGTKTGIYASSDNAKTWVFQQSAGIVSVNTFTTANRNIYAGTSAGIIKTALGQYGVKSSSPENPLSLQVTNPSAASAIIRYSLKERGDASLFLYDIIGNECAKLFQDIREVGEYNMNWNTSLLPTGMYILRLNAGGNQTSVIMSVIH
jgi:hypothetical protein